MENTTNPSTNQTAEQSPVPSPMDTPNGDRKSKVWKILKFVIPVLIIAGIVVLAYYYKGLLVAATVDGHIISRTSVIKELEKQGGKQTLDLLIDKQLVNNEAQKQNITISDDEVNEVIKNYETIYSGQGGSLDDALGAQGMTREDLKVQITIQKKVEKLLGDKVKVTDEEVQKFIDDNKVPIAAGKEEETKKNIMDQLKQQKLGESSGQLLDDLRSKAKIKEFVQYK